MEPGVSSSWPGTRRYLVSLQCSPAGAGPHSEARTATAAPMKMTDEVEAVMGGVRMGVNVDIKRTDGKD